MFSAYGDIVQLENNIDYADGRVLKKIVKLMLPYELINFIYIACYFLMNEDKKISLVLKSFMYPYLNPMAWYLFSLLFFEIVLIFVYRKIFSNRIRCLSIYVIAALYICVCKLLDMGSHWYVSCVAFPIGVTLGLYDEKIFRFLKKKCYIFLFGLILSLIAMYVYHNISKSTLFKLPRGIYLMLMSVLFACIVSCFCQCLYIKNKFLNFVGNISFELYLIMGLFCINLKDKLLDIFKYKELTMVFIMILSVIGGLVLNKLMHSLLKNGESKNG
jgi:peptidoglycan/LPS O-acetylase OafA/YrhL